MSVKSVQGTQNQLLAAIEVVPAWKKVALRVALFCSAIGSFFKVMCLKLGGRKGVSYTEQQDHCRLVFQRCLGFPEVPLNFLTEKPITQETLNTFYRVASMADVKRISLADANISFENLKALVSYIAKELPACRHLFLPIAFAGKAFEVKATLKAAKDCDVNPMLSEDQKRDHTHWKELDEILKENGFQVDESLAAYSR